MRSDTVQRIEAAIESLDYRPNRSARTLKTGFTRAIGLLVPSVANPFHGAMAHAVELAAQARGFQVAARQYASRRGARATMRRRLLRLRHPRRDRDFVAFDLERFDDLIGRGLSVVALDMVNSNADGERVMDSVSMDDRRAGYLATQHLVELGHRRIGYVSGATPTMSRRDRLNGYRAALLAANIKSDPTLDRGGRERFGL